MALARNKLTAKAIGEISGPGMYGDGDGLYLRVHRSKDGGLGSRSWVLVYHQRGRRREMGLGGFPGVGLTIARARRDQARAELAASKPSRWNDERPLTGPPFGKVALALIADIEGSFRSDKHRRQWKTSLQAYAGPIWNTPVDQINTDAVLDCLRPIWGRIPETADRVRGRIERVLDVARVKGLRSGENPARWRGHLSLILPEKKRLVQGHHAAMPYEDVPGLLASLRLRRATAARMLELTILTAGRTGETVQARRREVDLANELWTIPAERMKTGKEHRVPLVGRALEIMREACEGREPGQLLFPGWKPGRPASNMAMAMLLRRMEVTQTVHGFRSAFRDWAGDETDVPEEIVEQALAHSVGSSVRRAYRRGDALEKRRDLMKAWDLYCASATIKLAMEMAFRRGAQEAVKIHA